MNVNEMALANVKAKRIKFMQEYNRRLLEIEQKPEYKIAISEHIAVMSDFFKVKNMNVIKEAAKKRNDDIKKVLIKYGYSENYLDQQFYCEKCHDSDTDTAVVCECIERERRRLLMQQLNQSTAMSKNCTFENVDLDYYKENKEYMSVIFTWCKNYTNNFTTHLSQSILMSGRTGLGKTHFSLAIANEIMKSGHSVAYQSSLDMFGNIEKEYFVHKSTEAIDCYKTVDLLIIDDLGTELDNKFYQSKLYEIVEVRMNTALPMIVNTNLSLEGISQKYGERIASRFSLYTPLIFVGRDIRQIKKLK